MRLLQCVLGKMDIIDYFHPINCNYEKGHSAVNRHIVKLCELVTVVPRGLAL